MTEQERLELAALDAYWTRSTEEMPFATYRRWCDLQVMRRDALATEVAENLYPVRGNVGPKDSAQ